MHQCQLGLKDPNGEFVMKPTRLVPSSPMIAAGMSLRCKGDHVHAEVQWRGQGMSSSLAEWTPQMGQTILRGILSQHQYDVNLGFPVYDMEDVPEGFHLHEPAGVFVHDRDRLRRSAAVVFREAEEEAGFERWSDVPSLLRSAIFKVHRQYSHSLRGDELVRHLRLGGASQTAIKAAKLFSCEVCEREVQNLSRPVAAVPKYERFGECIATDVAFVPFTGDCLHALLVVVDMATHFTIASYLCSGENPGDTCKPTSDQAQIIRLDNPTCYGGVMVGVCVCVYHLNRCKTSHWLFTNLQGDWSRFAYPVQRSYGISVDEWSDQPLVPAISFYQFQR